MRCLALLCLAGCAELEMAAPPAPPAPAPKPITPCTGPRTQVKDAWTVEVLSGTHPALGHDRVVFRRGTKWETAPITQIVGAPTHEFDVDNVWATAVDRDGTVYFRGLWYGNGDQINNVGDGLYRLDGSRAIPLVDPSTRLPGSTAHFNSAGGFSVDGGWLAFWGGRPYEVSGVYLWRAGQVIALADTTMPVRGTGSPSVHAGRVAFQGERDGQRGIYVWSEATGAKLVLRSTGPIFGSVTLGDRVLYAGAFEPHRVIGWSAGTEWIAAKPEWFAGSVGDQPILDVDPAVRGDDVVVLVAQGMRSELWNVSGCTLERIAGTGDPAGASTIASVAKLGELPDGDFVFQAALADKSTHLARAHHRATTP